MRSGMLALGSMCKWDGLAGGIARALVLARGVDSIQMRLNVAQRYSMVHGKLNRRFPFNKCTSL
jgi:hypothetical protein